MTVQIETAPATDVRVSGTPEPVAVPDQRTGSRRLGSTIDATTPEDTGRPELSAEDLDAQSPAADLVRVYLNGIGKTALLTAAQEVDLAKRIEAGVFAQHGLDSAAAEGAQLDRQHAADLLLGHDAWGARWTVLRDVEGNEFCVGEPSTVG